MDGNLPQVLPSGGSSGGEVSGDTYSISEGMGAMTSINSGSAAPETSVNGDAAMGMTSVSDYGKKSAPPSTSVERLGRENSAPTTSVHHNPEPEEMAGGMSEKEKDELWYEQSQKRIAERRMRKPAANENATSGTTSPSKKGPFDIITQGTGLTFTDKGTRGFDRKLKSHFRRNRTSFKNFSTSDKKEIHDIIATKIASKRTGAKITRYDRISMRRKAGKLLASRQIEKSDYRDMKKIISRLESH